MSNKIIKHLLARSFCSSKMPNSLANIVEKLDGFAAVKTAESWDNVGLLIEPATPTYVFDLFFFSIAIVFYLLHQF